MTLPAAAFGPADGPPLVALHGFLGRGMDWQDLAARLPAVHLVAPDLPGHGAAAHLPDGVFPMESAATAVLDTMDARGIDRAALLGYSMGGRLALFLALHAPERFTHLVLESASPGLKTDAERAERRRLDADRAAEIAADLPGFLERWYALPLFAQTPHETRHRLVQQRAHNDAGGLARSLALMGTGAQPSLWPHLPALRVPTTLVVGARDAKFVAVAQAMAAANAGLRVALVPGAGHTVHLDAPEAFAALVAQSLPG